MKLKTFNLTILVVTFLTLITLPTISGFQGSFENLPRYFDASMPYSYLIESNGTHYFMMNGTTHQMEYSSTNASAVINSALGNLTVGRIWLEKVKLVGNFTIDSPIVVPEYGHLDMFNARIKLADNSNCSIIVNENRATMETKLIIIEGGVIDANKDNNYGTSHGIDILKHSHLWINDMEFVNVRNDTFHFNDVVQLKLLRCGMWSVGGYGIYCYAVSDSEIAECLPIDGGTDDGSVFLSGCGGFFKIHDNYINNRVKISSCSKLFFHHNSLDISTDGHGILVSFTTWSLFDNLIIRVQGDGATTYAGLRLYGTSLPYSCNNTVTNIQAGRFGFSGTRTFDYAVEEYDSNQNWNIFSNINGLDCNVGALRVLGANSGYCNSTILGGIVTS